MITVTLYTISKRNNSTKLPGDNGQDFSCTLKDDTAVSAPEITFVAKVYTAVNFTQYNYAYISAFNRYYFITDWRFTTGRWVASMSVDVLASNRAEIGNLSRYVIRSNRLTNPNIVDMLYPVMSNCTVVRVDNTSSAGLVSDISDGFFVLGCIGKGAGNFGSVCYYKMSLAQFQNFAEVLMSNTNWANISTDEISESLQRALINPMQYITSCRWYPISHLSIVGDSVTSVDLGFWSISASATKIANNQTADAALTFNLTTHPQVARGNWLNMQPYTKRYIFINSVGFVEVKNVHNAAALLTVTIRTDITTGDAVVEIKDNGGGAFNAYTQVFSSKIGCDVPLTQISSGFSEKGFVTGVFASLINTNLMDFLAKESTFADTIYNIANSTFPATVSGSGATGSPYLFQIKPYMISLFASIADEDYEENGRPLCAVKKVSDIAGYMVLQKADFWSSSTTRTENEKINALLEGGFWYE